MFGSRKLSSAHSSVRLFCSGVPVSSSRLPSLQRSLSSLSSRQFMFFSLRVREAGAPVGWSLDR